MEFCLVGAAQLDLSGATKKEQNPCPQIIGLDPECPRRQQLVSLGDKILRFIKKKDLSSFCSLRQQRL